MDAVNFSSSPTKSFLIISIQLNGFSLVFIWLKKGSCLNVTVILKGSFVSWDNLVRSVEVQISIVMGEWLRYLTIQAWLPP